jgi:hydroxyquinol 1,2-dioxygenase
MTGFDEHTLTEAVLRRLDGCADPRTRQVLQSLVRHLHDFVRDVGPSEAEWFAAIDFLTRTGQKCDDKRQEFILLSDTLGVSMLVDAINHRRAEGVTETTVLGPFFVEAAPELPLGADIAGDIEGRPLYVEGSVSAPDGTPVAGATVDVWQSDGEGFYDLQQPGRDGFALRARLRADAAGRFDFWSIMPVSYPIPTDGPAGQLLATAGRHPYRPAHVHFMIRADGFEQLVTHVFVAGDDYLDSDVVFGVKDSLIRDFARRESGVARDGTPIKRPHHHLRYDFGLRPAASG